jgi:hypothetical protein
VSYRRAVRRAFRDVTFYRSQCAAAGRPLDEPVPTPTSAVPDPPYELCPWRRPWRPDADGPLWTPDPRQLVGALRIAGRLPSGGTVVEVRPSLVNRRRLTRRVRYAVLLGADALVATEDHRRDLNTAALTAAVPPVLVVGAPAVRGVDAAGGAAGGVPVVDVAGGVAGRVPVVDVAGVAADAVPDGPVLLHDPVLGYLGARDPRCGALHLDPRLVHAAVRDGALALSLLRRRRPTLLAMVPPGADGVRPTACARHGTPVLVRTGAGSHLCRAMGVVRPR